MQGYGGKLHVLQNTLKDNLSFDRNIFLYSVTLLLYLKLRK